MRQLKSIGVIALFMIIAAILTTSQVIAAPPSSEDFEGLNVSVEVASQTWIDISPDHIRWYNVNPGEDSTNFTETEHGTTNHDGIVVRNIGSTDIKTVWFNASYPADLPYGSGDLTEYDTANFVLLSKADVDGNNSAQMATTDYYYINKKEYSEATRIYVADGVYSIYEGRNIPYLQTFDTLDGRNVTIGRLRDGANEYFWAILANDGGTCDKADQSSSGAKLSIGILPHNETTVGDVDLTTGCEAGGTCEELDGWTAVSGDDHYYGKFDLGTNRWRGSVVRLDADCKGVAFVTWNKDLAGTGLFTIPNDDAANYWLANTSTYSGGSFLQGTDLNGELAPGEYYTGWLKLRLPWGIPAGTLDTGTITVLVSTGNPNSA